jgi:hypothetical protein
VDAGSFSKGWRPGGHATHLCRGNHLLTEDHTYPAQDFLFGFHKAIWFEVPYPLLGYYYHPDERKSSLPPSFLSFLFFFLT